MNRIQPNETELIGDWLADGNGVTGDKICKRIRWLVGNVLRKMGYSKKEGAWETLYLDPEDGRYWILTYPQGGMHGGGPPALRTVSKEVVGEEFVITEGK